MKYLVLGVLVLLTAVNTSQACSAFLLENQNTKLLAKNYDWDLEHGYALVNKRNVQKKALSLVPNEKTAEWISQYGSVTLNQYGREFPNSGLNEKGLAVEILWLNESIYPKADQRPSINELQWVQYQLDNHSTVAEVIATADTMRVANFYATAHYFVCDASGECATLEYLNGKLVVHSGATLTPKLITNSTQEESSTELKKYQGFGGTLPIPTGPESIARYIRAASLLQTAPVTVASALDVLWSVRQGDYTKWNIVYNLTDKAVSFRSLSFQSLKTVQLDEAGSFSCKTPVLGFDVESLRSGNVSQNLEIFSTETNTKLVEKSLATLGELGKKLSPYVSNYPASTVCME